jgi:hypothetical protein
MFTNIPKQGALLRDLASWSSRHTSSQDLRRFLLRSVKKLNVNNKYYLALMSSFIGSIFGAGILVDSIFWVLLGINIFMLKANPNSSILMNV